LLRKETLDRGVVIWGPPASGKTTFLAALSIALNRQQRGWNVVGADERSEESLIKHTTDLAAGRFPGASVGISHYRWVLNGWMPRTTRGIFRTQIRRDPVSVSLDLTDSQGEYFSKDRTGHVWDMIIANLERSRGIIYFFDPVRESERGDAWEHTFPVLLQLARKAADMSDLPDGRLPHYLAVCVTKFDEPRVLGTAERLRFLESEPDGPYHFPRVDDSKAREFFRELSGMAGNRNSGMLLNAIEQYFMPDRIKYFATSSIGFYVDPEAGCFKREDFRNLVRDGKETGVTAVRGGVCPINVVEPLLWLTGKIADAPTLPDYKNR